MFFPELFNNSFPKYSCQNGKLPTKAFSCLLKGGKKPSGRISAEKAEKMTVSQEKMEDSRSHMTSKEYKLQKDQHLRKNSKTLQGQYVLMAHEVTMPPFLGQTLPPAFKLLNFSRENQNHEQRFFQSNQQVKGIKPHSQGSYPRHTEVNGIFPIECSGSWIQSLHPSHPCKVFHAGMGLQF
ncbi:MORN repeat-containing protein 1 isoform X2 [Calonectris borealis]|uniref:MORN repeat-containing protein 1 isoform X2 n=1 Tax=Calonectris borealis TaxID=1323832 RepID=UPI003F4B7521